MFFSFFLKQAPKSLTKYYEYFIKCVIKSYKCEYALGSNNSFFSQDKYFEILLPTLFS